MGSGWSTPRPYCFTSGYETWYPLYRRLGGSQGRCGRVRKISPPTGIRFPDRSSCRYSDWAIANHKSVIGYRLVYESSLCMCACKIRLGSGFGNKQGQNLSSYVCKTRFRFGVALCIQNFMFWICMCINIFRMGGGGTLHFCTSYR